MRSLAEWKPRVQPTPPDISFDFGPEGDCEPFMSPADVCYQPSPTDAAFWVAFNAALDGDRPDCPSVGAGWSPEQTNGFYLGARAGKVARESREAKAIGRTLGEIGGGSEPPAGYSEHEADAYRAGFAEAQAYLEEQEDLDFEGWVAAEELRRSAGMTDRDQFEAVGYYT